MTSSITTSTKTTKYCVYKQRGQSRSQSLGSQPTGYVVTHLAAITLYQARG